MEKICVYTCITGNYDDLKEVKIKEDNIDYICFTNNKELTSNSWKIIYIEDNSLDNHYLSRKIKMLGHPYIDKNYNLSIWIDASIIFKKSVNEFLNQYFDYQHDLLAACKHNARNSIKEEAQECIRLVKDKKEIIEKQLELYETEKFPDNLGLLEMTLIVKRHNNKLVKKTMELWFDMISKYSKRDQLSFMYCLYKTKLPFKEIPLNVWDNEYIEFSYHNKNKFDYTYQVFYSDKESFDEADSFKNNYKKQNEKYILEFSLKQEVNKLRIDLSDIVGVSFSLQKVEGIEEKDFIYKDILIDNNNYITLSDDSQIIINKNLKKKTKIKMIFTIKVLSIHECIELTQKYINKSNELENKVQMLSKNNRELRQELNNILNSKAWKIVKKIWKIKKVFPNSKG